MCKGHGAGTGHGLKESLIKAVSWLHSQNNGKRWRL